MFENDKKHGANGSKNGGKQETTHGDLKIAILGLIFLGQKEIVSSNVSWFFPPSESGANIYKATGGTAGQMERREDVPLIDAAERVGEWKQGRVAVAVLVLVVGGGGVSLSNSARITDTSAVHLQRSHQAFNISPPPCKVYRAATAGWRVFHKRLSLFSFHYFPHKLARKRAQKEKATHSTG